MSKEIDEIYYQWVKEKKVVNLTNNQARFAKFLIEHREEVTRLGGFDSVFTSVRFFLKELQSTKQ